MVEAPRDECSYSDNMTKLTLKQVLDAEGFNPRVYSLDGGSPNERLCMSAEAGKWCVYYSERGRRTGEQCYGSEEEACQDLLRRLRGLPPYQTRFGSP